nr:PREDICTED: transcription factor 23 isoform X1 [Lepisosteus oculatus]
MAERLSGMTQTAWKELGTDELPGNKVLQHRHRLPQRYPAKWVQHRFEPQEKLSRPQHSPENAARERSRVRNLRQAFHSLQAALPAVPPDTKLSKLDILVLATNYIAHLTQTLDQGRIPTEQHLPPRAQGYLHPVKKWPMRSLLYCGSMEELLTVVQTSQKECSGEEDVCLQPPDPGSHPIP